MTSHSIMLKITESQLPVFHYIHRVLENVEVNISFNGCVETMG
jgi:hypothetical protein